MILQKLKQPRFQTLVAALSLMFIVILYVELSAKPTAQNPESVDTYIPAGFVLVPIELQNADSLSSMIGDFAVVDLFTGLDGQQRRVGRSLKLIRAPLNPDRLAVFVPDDQVASLLKIPGPYWAALQNPNNRESASIQKDKKPQSRIEYFDGSTN